MKICPFISHMIGEDHAGVLEIQEARDADAGSGEDSGTQAAAHLFCLKETCRFYRSDEAECSFDVVFDRIDAQARAAKHTGDAAAPKKTLEKVDKELEKFWALQTRSVAELVETIGETEKNTHAALEHLEKKIAEAIESRGDNGLDTVHDELSRLNERSGDLSARLENLESSLPSTDDVRDCIRESLPPAGNDDVAEEMRALRDQLQSLVDASAGFEKRFQQWQEQIDERVDAIHGGRTAWAESLAADAAEDPAPAQAERKRKSRKLNNLGVTSFHNGELELARDQFLEAITLDDGFAECYNNLGLVYSELGEDQKATDAFSAAVDINPGLHAAYNNLGYVFYKQGSYDQAIEMYNEALGRNASNTSAYTNLGNACFKQGKRDEARGAWEKALELDPSNRKASQSLKQLEREAVIE